MLRALVVALLIANGLFFAWSQGWLDRLTGVPAHGDREPQRLASQVRPELVQVWRPGASGGPPSPVASAGTAPATAASGTAAVASSTSPGDPTASGTPDAARSAAASAASGPPSTLASAPSAASAPAAATKTAAVSGAAPAGAGAPPPAVATASAPADACLEAGPFTTAELAAAEAAMRAALPAGAWTQRKAEGSGEWMIYMGPYPDREFMDRKKAELSRIRGGVPQEEVQAPPELARGLSLGRFPSQAAANATLAQYRLRGIRTARVVRSGNGPPVVYLRVAKADAALAAQAAAVKLPGTGRAFGACNGSR